MPELNIFVCMKVVPKSEEIRVNTETMAIIREGVRSEINPPDMNALEMAYLMEREFPNMNYSSVIQVLERSDLGLQCAIQD